MQKHTYKHNKKSHLWWRRHGKIALATSVTGCLAVGYIVSIALASPKLSDQRTDPRNGRSGSVSRNDQNRPDPTATPSPTPSGQPTPGSTPTPAKNTAGGASSANPTATPAATPKPFVPGPDLTTAAKKEIAMQLVSSAENSSLNWKAQYAYIEDIGDGRGYTAGIIGFCSGTGDMLQVVSLYNNLAPNNVLTPYIPALTAVNGTASHAGLDPGFVAAWQSAAGDVKFQQAQNSIRDDEYFNPAVNRGISDGVHALGQFVYYDAMVMHGSSGFNSIRATAMAKAKTPAQGGDETIYLHAFLDARKAEMLTEAAHSNTDRVDTAQRVFLNNGNLNLDTPLSWSVYGDAYTIK